MAILNEIKAKEIFAGPGMFAFVAEAVLSDIDGNEIYVTWQEYDGKELTVSRESVYDFLAGDKEEPAGEFIEEYRRLADAKKKSEYGKVFEMLKGIADKLGEEV